MVRHHHVTFFNFLFLFFDTHSASPAFNAFTDFLLVSFAVLLWIRMRFACVSYADLMRFLCDSRCLSGCLSGCLFLLTACGVIKPMCRAYHSLARFNSLDSKRFRHTDRSAGPMHLPCNCSFFAGGSMARHVLLPQLLRPLSRQLNTCQSFLPNCSVYNCC